ncbi:hypothetical protein FACS1894142_2730 [Spirochaetia bacterium]|nr:hypothetical protein FACS1894142_2730 [Spirochaetia bacterium]
MRRTNIKGLSFDTIKLEGSCFTAEIVEKAVVGTAAKEEDADYQIPRGLRLLDEIGRSFQIAQAQWKGLEDKKLTEKRFIREFFIDALSYTPELFEKLVNINPLESAASWYIVCDTRYLRLVRKSASLARPSYLEFNLETILRESRFPEYQMLYRVIHGSRTLGLDNDGKGECVWDVWKKAGEELGVRVREGLRVGVTRALSVLGQGFLSYDIQGKAPGNNELRQILESGELSNENYFQELMRLMYRFLFIITVEERGLIFEHLPDTTEQTEAGLHAKHSLYEKGYSLRRLRERSARYTAADNYGDLWEGIKIVFASLSGNKLLGDGTTGNKSGNNPLDLPILGGLFNADQCPHLDKCGLSNAALLEAMFRIRWTVEGNARTLIDYKNMGVEELGSIYESLLELAPQVDVSRATFGFLGFDIEGSTAGNGIPRGNLRKTSGSYYTGDSLVQCLIKSNLDPLIEEKLAASKIDQEKTILSITVIDPSCGSGHFLLAASRRLAEHLAAIRTNGTITDISYRAALRDIISSSIYGVDLNPLAVELARMALWLEGYEPGKPLSFLDHHIRCGNSLIGVLDFEALSKGIPDDAYKALSGDDKEFASKLKKRNKNENMVREKAQNLLFESSIEKSEAALTAFHWRLENIQNDSLTQVEEKRTLFANLQQSPEYLTVKKACDLYTASFYTVKKEGHPVPTTADLNRAVAGQEESSFSLGVNALSAKIAGASRFFHWRLEFPEVFTKGGFDCVLGNPPWERIKLQEEEFFAARSPEIAAAPNKAIRDRMIRALQEGNEYEKSLYAEFIQARRDAEAASLFAHVNEDAGGRFPLTGTGDVNTYALFAETILQIRHTKGRAGFIVPTGIATDDSTKNYFAKISGSSLISLYDFENREGIFPAVDSRMKFSLLSLGDGAFADLSFFLTNTTQLADTRRHFKLLREEFTLLNPNTLTCPVFRSEKDAELTKNIYRRVPVLIKEEVSAIGSTPNPWGIQFMRMFDMSNDSGLFQTSHGTDQLPLYEAKLIHQFDHRWATYNDSMGVVDVKAEQKQNSTFTIRPHYWVDKSEVLERITGKRETEDNRVNKTEEQKPSKWLMGWRDITNAMNERTVIASIIPQVGAGDTFLLLFSKIENANLLACLLADQNSMVHDYIARQKVAGVHLKYHTKKQIPILPPSAYSAADLAFVVPKVLELTYTAVDLAGFAEDIWNDSDAQMRLLLLKQRYGPEDASYVPPSLEFLAKQSFTPSVLEPFVFNPDRRAQLRASLDARYAKLYGLSRDELRYILDPARVMGEDYPSETFRVLKDKEMTEYGEYRTGRLVLEAWDIMEGMNG